MYLADAVPANMVTAASNVNDKIFLAHKANCVTPHKILRNSIVHFLMLWAHSWIATYCCRYTLFTPRKGRRKLRNPVQKPSLVLTWTSRISSPSSSLAQTRLPGVWQTVT